MINHARPRVVSLGESLPRPCLEDKSGKPAAREVRLVTSYNGSGKKNGPRER